LFKFFNKIYTVVKLAIVFSNAQDELAKGNLEEAERLFDVVGEYPPMVDVQFKIMKGYLYFKLGKREQCLTILEEAWVEIDSKGKLSDAEKCHLKGYIWEVASVYQKDYGMDLKHIHIIDFSDIPLDLVRNHLKRQFPTRDHPDWDQFGGE